MNNPINKIETLLAKGVGEIENLIHHPVYKTNWYVLEVDPGKLWRCSWPNAEHLKALKALGVEVVVNFCSERSQDEAVRAAGMEPVNIPFMDNTVPAEELVERFLAITAPKAAHCEKGIARTGCMIAKYRERVNGWKPEAALVEAEHFGLCLPEQKAFILGTQERG